jgi:L-fucose isomerase-like protein
MSEKSKFALFFGNRGFFPASLQIEARAELPRVLKAAGHDFIMMDETATRYGAVETPREGEAFANFLRDNRGNYDGVILSLPNFGDENGAISALKDAGVPILIQAYPDDLEKMAPEVRRDAFCGKFSVMDVFHQHHLKFSVFKPHVVQPSSPKFSENLDSFDRVCRVVKGFRHLSVGAIGARTTAFKSVRFDEITLERAGVTIETFDLADVIHRVKCMNPASEALKEKKHALRVYTSWEGIPDEALENIARLGTVIDEIISEYGLDAIAIRCWLELQQQLGISPCVLMGLLNNNGKIAACEVDICNAVAMSALSYASGGPATILDWNNNYGEDEEKCILFHCGPVPADLMVDRGRISDHLILRNSVGENRSFGCVVGRIAPGDLTFGSLCTENGRVKTYFGEGRFTEDPIPSNFFGAAGVAEIDRLQDVLLYTGKNGYRHHVSVTKGKYVAPIQEALEKYLGFDVVLPQTE